MIEVRRSGDRGRAAYPRVESLHTFSFGEYYDANHIAFGALRVINEDVVGPGGAFPMHPHRDVEVVTWVIEGAIEHRDSLGTRDVVRAGEAQRITAGTGIEHSEANPSATERLHLLQIWILPSRRGLAPSYEKKAFPLEGRRGRLAVVASPDGAEGSMRIAQDARILAATVDAGGVIAHEVAAGRRAWVQMIRGEVAANGVSLRAGDGAAVTVESRIRLCAADAAELLLFDLP